MSEVVNPPDYYFTGINFNPAFYTEDTTGLSQSVANTLYLRKTVPDTATAQETFSSGIITPTINSTSTGFLNVVVPMVDSGSGLNMAVAPRTITGQIHHYSDGDNCVAGAGVHLNNGLNNNSATNIHNGTGANPSGIVNIMTGTSNTGTINIGTTGTTTNVKGTINVNTTVAGTLTIGSSASATTINGKTNLNLSDVAILNIKSLSSGQAQILCQPFADTDTIVYFRDAGRTTIRGTIQGISAGSIAYNATSDRRLKKDIKPMNSMLDTIMSLKPCEYRWVSGNELSHGFIAQEVHKLFPEMRYGANGCEDIENPCNCETGEPVYYGLDYGKFTPYMVKAFQELKEDYDAKLAKLEARLLALER